VASAVGDRQQKQLTIGGRQWQRQTVVSSGAGVGGSSDGRDQLQQAAMLTAAAVVAAAEINGGLWQHQ
jgi:hypothetical protein